MAAWQRLAAVFPHIGDRTVCNEQLRQNNNFLHFFLAQQYAVLHTKVNILV